MRLNILTYLKSLFPVCANTYTQLTYMIYFYSFIAKYWAKQSSCGLKRPKQTTIHHAGVKGGSAGEEQAESAAHGGSGGAAALQEVH